MTRFVSGFVSDSMGRPPKRRHAATLTGRREKEIRRDIKQDTRLNETASEHAERLRRIQRQQARHMHLGAAFGSNFEDSMQQFDVGNMNSICHHEHCLAQNFAGEKVDGHFSICCGNGKVSLPEESLLKSMPEELLQLFVGSDVKSRNFRDHILNYNSALAYASLKQMLTFRQIPVVLTLTYTWQCIHDDIKP